MKISPTALDECEPLFRCFVDVMWRLRTYRDEAFLAVENKSLTTETLRVLTSYFLDRSQGTYCLLVNGLVWDAEIVLRSVYESFSKIMLIATASSDERQKLVNEFWETLGAIYDRKAAQKSRPAEELARDFNEDDARIFRHLRDPNLFRTEPTGQKKTRKEIEQRWSFSGIVAALTKDGRVGKIIGLDALLHAYSMGSHVAHASPIAFDLMEDRSLRGDDLNALEVGHVCRMLSDIVALSCFSIFFAEQVWKPRDRIPPQLDNAFKEMMQATQAHQERFQRSQDKFYAELSKKEGSVAPN